MEPIFNVVKPLFPMTGNEMGRALTYPAFLRQHQTMVSFTDAVADSGLAACPQLPISGAASAPALAVQAKPSLILRLHFLGKHFPLLVTTATPHSKTLPFILSYVVLNICFQ